MVDLVTDFKKIIDISTEDTINILKNTFVEVNSEKNELFVRSISKYYMIMSIWNKKLKETTQDYKIGKLLDNILLDYCSILNCVILGDEKVLNFLYRNIIESVLRVISSEFESKEIDALFNGIGRDCSGSVEKTVLNSYSSLLKSIYNVNCLYIHTDVEKIPDNLINLIAYNNNSKELNTDNLIKKFDDLNIAILCIFQIKYYNIYINLKSNAKGLMDELIPFKNRVKFSEVEKEIRSNVN